MPDPNDPRFQSPQFLGTVSDLEEFKKEKARKKAHEESRDLRPDAEVLAFPESTPPVEAPDPDPRSAMIREIDSMQIDEIPDEEWDGMMEELDSTPSTHEHDCPDDES